MSWLWRGTQSAIFYYLSCSPYYECVKRRKYEKERKLAKAEVEENGDPSRTLQSETNPYWTEEIMIGPSRGKGKISQDNAKSDSTRRLNTGKDSSAGESIISAFPSLEGVELDENSWNRKRYQRPDEYLWGSEDQNGSYTSLNSRAANKPLVSGDGAFYQASGPATVELHPPILTKKPSHPSQALWMVQPPPAAKVMEGKEPANRSRSVSNASCGTGGALAGRQASLRRMANHQQDDLPGDLSLSPPDDEDYTYSRGQRHDRSTSDPYRINADLKPLMLQLPPDPRQRGSRMNGTITRPQLPTVNSEHESDNFGLQVVSPNGRPISPSTSLQELQKLAPLDTVSAIRPSSPPKDAQNTELPQSTELEEQLLDSKDFDYISRHRWSMDI